MKTKNIRDLKAWVHNVKNNPIDDDQLEMAEAIEELLNHNELMYDVVKKVANYSHWNPIYSVTPEAKLARETLEKLKDNS